MVVGARTGAFVDKGVIRKATKSLLKKLTEYLSGETILDFNSGLRIFRKGLAPGKRSSIYPMVFPSPRP